MNELAGRRLRLAYGDRVIVDDLSVVVPPGSFTALIGPNACGKSTLLKALARLLRPASGEVTLDGVDLHGLPTKQVARQLAMLAQSAAAPEGITVHQLVSRGRFPHQGLLHQWSEADEQAVAAALRACGLTELARRSVSTLSGGQRQRAWLALALAQETELLLLDEPTTYLDITHQIEVLDLCRRLNSDGTTILAVLHDINQACRYADHLVALRGGRLIAQGPPAEIVTAELIEEVFGLACRVVPDPETMTPLIVPKAPS